MKSVWMATAVALVMLAASPTAFATRFHWIRRGHNAAHHLRYKMHRGHMHVHNLLYHGHM